MSNLKQWSLTHDCWPPRLSIPDGVSRGEGRWRCPTCGQLWRVIVRGNSQEARRIPLAYPNLRKWRWRRRVAK